MFNVVAWLRGEGYQVQSSWPDLDSVQCTDEILYTVMKMIEETGQRPPCSLEHFIQFLQTQCKIPAYISMESVITKMQQMGFLSLHRGQLKFEMPIFIDPSVRSVPPAPLTPSRKTVDGQRRSIPKRPPSYRRQQQWSHYQTINDSHAPMFGVL